MQTIISLWIVSIEITSKSNLNETVAQTETFISGYRKIYSACLLVNVQIEKNFLI